ncbi:hypothetical protein BDZ91DRAFT_783466 [Kalaharituber pfeilii]|nr:hypothetical protein BDZ91DRAFT_783466 [Kalaharituber pfeilii]
MSQAGASPGIPNVNAFDYSILRSELFQILLKSDDAVSQSEGSEVLAANSCRTSDSGGPFYVHRSLLASMSPELDKHVHNEMKEGKTGIIVFKEVDSITMERVLEWGYTKKYCTGATGPASILIHTRIYIYADRFNINRLKGFSFACLSSELRTIGCPPANSDLHPHLAQIIEYAFCNICAHDVLLEYYANYLAWGLATIRQIPAYKKLFATNVELATAVILALPPLKLAPWFVFNFEHILNRRWKQCQKVGVAKYTCPSCRNVYTGSQVNPSGTKERWNPNDTPCADYCFPESISEWTAHKNLQCHFCSSTELEYYS